MRLKVTCDHCKRPGIELARNFWVPGKWSLICPGCESEIWFEITPDRLARHAANQIAGMHPDPQD